MANSKPRVAITLGDPAGIGPEITLKALQSDKLRNVAIPVVVGSKSALESHARTIGGLALSSLLGPQSSTGAELIDIPLPLEPLVFGKVSASCGVASYEYLKAAMGLAKRGQVEALVTAPVHKESWKAAQVPHVGHTEALNAFFEGDAETLFVVDKLRIFFLTRHVSLREAIDLISVERILSILRHATAALRWFGIDVPRIAVSGLNPHAGDGGLFGTEEIEILAPAVAAAQREGIRAFGPLPSDCVFHQCAEGEFDAVIALYHDQGHLAAKMRSFLGTVSVTTGLQVLRTSVDHGTAFDIAGKNRADPTSLIEAIKVAAELVRRRGLGVH